MSRKNRRRWSPERKLQIILEPLPPEHPLLRLDNVTITPHIAGSTRDAFRNSPSLMAGHVTRMLKGESGLPVVNGFSPAWGSDERHWRVT